MKVLHIVSGLSASGGGTSAFVPDLCRSLKEIGTEVTLATIVRSDVSSAARKAESDGVAIQMYELTTIHRPLRTLSYSIGLDRAMKHLVAAVDVVHLHGLWQWPCWRAAWEAKRQGKPYVVQTHGFLEPERLKKSAIKKKIVGALVERRVLNGASRLIATAQSEAEGLREYGLTRPIDIVPIGMDTSSIDEAVRGIELFKKWSISEGKRVLLYLSRIAPIKGLDMLAEAWGRMAEFHDEWQLVIAGPGDRGFEEVVQNDFKRRIHDNSVTFTGPVYGPEKFKLLKSADAFVLPTRSENFSIAVQEALAAGLPVVCTKGAPWASIEREGCGYWVDISSAGIEFGLRKVLSLSESERRVITENGKRFIRRAFNWDGIAKQMVGVYRRAIDEYEV